MSSSLVRGRAKAIRKILENAERCSIEGLWVLQGFAFGLHESYPRNGEMKAKIIPFPVPTTVVKQGKTV